MSAVDIEVTCLSYTLELDEHLLSEKFIALEMLSVPYDCVSQLSDVDSEGLVLVECTRKSDLVPMAVLHAGILRLHKISYAEKPVTVEIIFLSLECVGTDAADAEQSQN